MHNYQKIISLILLITSLIGIILYCTGHDYGLMITLCSYFILLALKHLKIFKQKD